MMLPARFFIPYLMDVPKAFGLLSMLISGMDACLAYSLWQAANCAYSSLQQ